MANTVEDRIAKLVQDTDGSLLKLEKSGEPTRFSHKRRLFVGPYSSLGLKRKGRVTLARAQAAFEEAGISPQPPLTGDGLTTRQWVYFGRTRPRVEAPSRRLMFEREHDLERFVFENFNKLPELCDLEVLETQYPVSDTERADILCRDRRTNGYAVVELKKGDPGKGIVAQINKYMAHIVAHEATDGKPVRGIVITGQPNAHL